MFTAFGGSATVSPLCGAPFGARPFFMRAAFTSIRMLIREKRKKCDFSFFLRICLLHPKFYILHSTFYILHSPFAPRGRAQMVLSASAFSSFLQRKIFAIFVRRFLFCGGYGIMVVTPRRFFGNDRALYRCGIGQNAGRRRVKERQGAQRIHGRSAAGGYRHRRRQDRRRRQLRGRARIRHRRQDRRSRAHRRARAYRKLAALPRRVRKVGRALRHDDGHRRPARDHQRLRHRRRPLHRRGFQKHAPQRQGDAALVRARHRV